MMVDVSELLPSEATIVDNVTDRSNQPILCKGWILDDKAVGSAVPNHHVGAGPSMSGAEIASVAYVDAISFYAHVVKQSAR